jgi:phospholipid/cholesterol/gamma-HCH transport system substrate-binding protein
MSGLWRTALKFTVFVVIAAVGGVFLFLTFGQFRSGSTAPYSAVFTDVSQLKSGDSVRVAGIRVGTVDDVRLGDDKKVSVSFSADRDVVLTTGTRAQVRYMNLVGDRYLELVDGPGSTRILPPGSQISEDRTAPALDLDLLLTGLKPVIKGLNPKDINTLSASLLDVLQGRGDTLESLLSKTSSFSNALADKGQVIEQVIASLDSLLGTLAKDGDKFSGAIDRLERLLTQLSADREPIGDAIESLNNGTASLADLLTQARPPLAGTVSQLNRLAPLLDQDKDRIDSSIQKLPANYRKLIRPGAYGSFINYYICGLTIRVTDLQGRTAIFPWVKQETGRCAES